MQTLYLKYRPQSFDEIIGQEHIKQTLKNEITNKTIAHAFLFAGPRGTGKTSIARIMAKTLNCQDEQNAPCLKCQSCEEIKGGKSLDVIEIDAASNTGVDNVRENIIDNARFTPFRDKYKVFIIDEVHMLSISAFNALLKVIEEPPQHVIFILCTTELHKLPETIVSRCQRFDFRKIDLGRLADYIVELAKKEDVKLAKEVADNIALLSGGFVRDALSILSQVLSLGKQEITVADAEMILPRSTKIKNQELIDLLLGNKIKESIELVNSLVEDGVDLEQFTLGLIQYLRDLALIKYELKVFNDDAKTREQAGALSTTRLLEFLNKFIEKLPQVKKADITQLPLEMACIELTDNGDNDNNNQGLKKEISNKTEQHEEASVKEMVKKEETKKHTIKDLLKNRESREVRGKSAQSEIQNKEEDLEKNPEPHGVQSKIKVKYKEIKERWEEVVEKSSAVNHGLKVALGTAFPLALEKNKLEIGFEHDFYCERYKDINARKLIEQALQNVFECDILVECKMMSVEERQKVREEKEALKEEEDKQAEDLALAFGGTIVQ